jgi:hypothetical protein
MTSERTGNSHSRIQRIDSGAARSSSDLEENLQRFSFNPRFVARCLATVIALIVITGAMANYAVYNLAPHPDHPIADVLKRFDLGHEPSIPAFYSASVMLATATFLIFLGRFDQSGGKSRGRHWYALSFLFVCLAIDESVMFHEMGTAAMNELDLGGQFYFSWILPGLAFAVIVATLFLRFLMSLNRRTGIGLILSGVVFVAGAIGMEFIAGLIFSAAATEEDAMRSVSHVLVQAVEEGLEMVGVAMFLCILIDYAKRSGLGVAVPNNASNPATANS